MASSSESTTPPTTTTANDAGAVESDGVEETVGQADIGRNSAVECNEGMEDSGDGSTMRSWRTLLEESSNKSRAIRGSNYVQLATVDPINNEPRCRTVVFRGFVKLPDDHKLSNRCDGMSCVMKMITDMRSEKVNQVMQHPSGAAEMVWWFPKRSEQYRIRGQLVFVGSGTFPYDDDPFLRIARKEQWGNISDSSREGFLVKENPGDAYSGEQKVPAGGRDESGKVLPPPDNFLLMLLLPKAVDYLRLTNMYRQRDSISDGGSWGLPERLNP